MTPFIYRGPLPPGSPLFRGRNHEMAQLVQLCQDEVRAYAIVYGGRQTGKTSLLLRLAAALPEHFRACRVDFQCLPRASALEAYAYLAERVAGTLARPAPSFSSSHPAPDLTRFICQALRESSGNIRLVLLLEELGALPQETQKDLANLLRSLFTSRFDPPSRALSRLMVILAGSIELYGLAATQVSTLHNVCEPLYLSDLSESDVVGLVADGLAAASTERGPAETLGQAAYAYAGGHPYLTQRLGALVAGGLPDVDAAVERLLYGDPLLTHLRRAINEQKLSDAVGELLVGKIRFSRLDEEMARLELLGLARESGGYWVVRNRLLEQALRAWGMALAESTQLPAPDESSSLPETRSSGEKDMDYKRGFQALKEYLASADVALQSELAALEERFWKNDRAERVFGSSENTRNERAQIIYALNQMALDRCGISFNDLCLGKQLVVQAQTPPTPNDREIIERLKRIETKLDQGRAEDRQAASQILDAITTNQVEQAEATQMVAELRAWAQAVQQAGLPLNPELHTAVDSLSQHTGGAYQYLQLAIPIIPGILSYNIELGSQHQLDLKNLWERFKQRLGKRAKGEGGDSGAPPLYGAGNRWAVLVGVNEYEDKANYGRLQVCVQDVHALRERLIAGGFEAPRIRLLTDDISEAPTRDNVLTALKAVADATEPDDLLLFYYSGHGEEDDGESYLVARNGRRLVLGDTAIRLRRVREIMEGAPARARVIILDACHSGANIGGKGPKPMSAGFIRRVFEQAEGLAVLASCKQGQLSYEWRENECSVFTHFLLEALTGEADREDKKLITVQDTHRYVTNGVKLWASQRNVSQTPTLEGKWVGDIILVSYK